VEGKPNDSQGHHQTWRGNNETVSKAQLIAPRPISPLSPVLINEALAEIRAVAGGSLSRRTPANPDTGSSAHVRDGGRERTMQE